MIEEKEFDEFLEFLQEKKLRGAWYCQALKLDFMRYLMDERQGGVPTQSTWEILRKRAFDNQTSIRQEADELIIKAIEKEDSDKWFENKKKEFENDERQGGGAPTRSTGKEVGADE